MSDRQLVGGEDGCLVGDESGRRLVFERRLAHPRAYVWRAIVDPVRRAKWFFPGTLEPALGGRVALVDSGRGITGTVTEIQPGELLGFTWDSVDGPDSAVRFELSDLGSGCRLTFTHILNDSCREENLMPGWHAIFDDLAVEVSGADPVPVDGRHAQLRNHYGSLL